MTEAGVAKSMSPWCPLVEMRDEWGSLVVVVYAENPHVGQPPDTAKLGVGL
jgi:hypothetical protein